MQHHDNHIELLESRIAPASVVTLTLTGHDLGISGDSNGPYIDVEQAPNGEWVFTSPTDTLFKVGAAAPAATVFLKGVTGVVTANLTGGANNLTFHDIHFGKDLTVNGGDFAVIIFTDAKVAGSVNVNGGANGSQVILDGVTIGHNLSVLAGNGQNFFDTGGLGLTVGGDCTFIGGSAADSALFSGGPVKIKGNFKLDGGSTGVSTFNLTPSQLSVGGALTMLDGSGISTFAISPGGTLKVGGALEVHTGNTNGSDPVAIGKGSHLVIVGGSLLVDEVGSTSGDVEIDPAGLLQVGGDLTVKHGGADLSTVNVQSDVVRIGGGVSVTSTGSFSTGPHISFGAATSFSVKKDFSVQGGTGTYDVRLQTPGALTVGGGIDIHAGGGGSRQLLTLVQGGTAHIGKDVSLVTNDAFFTGGISGGAFSIGGSLTFHSDAKLSESQNSARSLKVGHDLTVSGDTGLGYFSLNVRGTLTVGGDLAITAGAGTDEVVVVVPGSGKIAGNASVVLTGDTASITFGGHVAPLSIGGFAEFDASAQTSSTSLIQGLTVKGALSFSGILGDDTVSFDDLSVSGKTTINTGSGKDTINVETLATILHRASTFTKDVQIELGASNPATLTIGIAGAAEHRATFGAAAVFDGGVGAADTLNQRNVTFLKSGAPTITSFENFG